MHLLLSAAIALAAFDGLANAVPPAGTISMPLGKDIHKFRRNVDARRLRKRATPFAADLGNLALQGFYYVNVTAGTPGQLVSLDLDTGSSDVWMLGADACQTDETGQSTCEGGTYDISASNTSTLLSEGGFKIQYVTPGSLVEGDYIADNLEIGGQTVLNLTMAVADLARQVNTGILGVGFDLDESLVSQQYAAGEDEKPYQNLIDTMKTQGLISTRSYSLHLDDPNDATGTILFGGYDTDKFTGPLSILPLQPDAQSGNITSFTVLWQSLGVTTNGSSIVLDTTSTPDVTVLDSGTSLTVIPADLYNELASYFNVFNDDQGNAFVFCDLDGKTGSLDYQFGSPTGPVITVDFSELALVAVDTNYNILQQDGRDACYFGLEPQSEGEPLLFGDTFLRSAYVVYDIDALQVGIAQTRFNVSSSAVHEIVATSGQTLSGTYITPSTTIYPTTTGTPGQDGPVTATDGFGGGDSFSTSIAPGGTLSGHTTSYSGISVPTGTSTGAAAALRTAPPGLDKGVALGFVALGAGLLL